MKIVQSIKSVNPFTINDLSGAHGRIRTSDRLVRRQSHYSAQSIIYGSLKYVDGCFRAQLNQNVSPLMYGANNGHLACSHTIGSAL